MTSTPRRLAADLDLAPLPGEGGWFRETLQTVDRSTILFLVGDGEFSALHRLTAPETYTWVAGTPLRLLVIDGDGPREIRLDREHPRYRVEPGSWQGSSAAGDWTLVTTMMEPGFTWEGFELGERHALQQQWPDAADRIAELSRVPT